MLTSARSGDIVAASVNALVLGEEGPDAGARADPYTLMHGKCAWQLAVNGSDSKAGPKSHY